MKKIKFRFYIDHEHEEQWVNNMAEQGWYLTSFWPFLYVFERGTPGEYIYRSEMVINRKKDYYDFLDTMNIEHMHSFGVWAYFRKRKEAGPFEIFSGKSEKIKYLSRINLLFILVCLLNAFAVSLNIVPSIIHHEYQEITWFCLLNVLLMFLLMLEVYRNHKRKKRLKILTHIYED
ncbi:DUF2812 domain-containing protein [Lysinibacillus sp. NPDC097231]|uniref:DUF2812 domain-containing protein n=1 Tax=Lysinibacillus sp. NPDC097231 TaxID=3364142 RepID=UPI003815549B